jgi:hypothetical protein
MRENNDFTPGHLSTVGDLADIGQQFCGRLLHHHQSHLSRSAVDTCYADQVIQEKVYVHLPMESVADSRDKRTSLSG